LNIPISINLFLILSILDPFKYFINGYIIQDNGRTKLSRTTHNGSILPF
jgi:hypothetical protein